MGQRGTSAALGYAAPRDQAPSPVGRETAAVRVCFPARRLVTADQRLSNEQCSLRTGEAFGVRLSFLALLTQALPPAPQSKSIAAYVPLRRRLTG